jgi:hypothetical protein
VYLLPFIASAGGRAGGVKQEAARKLARRTLTPQKNN